MTFAEIDDQLREEPGSPEFDDAVLHLALVERALREDPNSFEFFTAVRLLERLQPRRGSVAGEENDPAGEAVRFVVNHALAYPASEIQTLELNDDAAARLKVNFMGLTGPLGVLPYAYSHLVIERLGARDGSLAAFLDLFHHRLLALFFKAWEKSRFIRRFERDGKDPLTDHLLDFAGIAVDKDRRIGPLRLQTFAGYAGLLGPEPRSAVALEHLIGEYFGVAVAIEQFAGGWYAVAPADQTALDEETSATLLGGGALVGDEVWDPQARVRIRMGPLTRTQFESFLPTGNAYATLQALVRLFSHDQFEFELQLVLLREEVLGLELGSPDAGTQRLGWSTWIRTTALATDPDQTVLLL